MSIYKNGEIYLVDTGTNDDEDSILGTNKDAQVEIILNFFTAYTPFNNILIQ